jgi:plasmid replication initiation protein
MMLGIEDKYPQFKEFRKYVLNVALKQIKEKTNLRYKWQGIKKGRSYSKIEFYEIHIAGKESPTELQEKALLQNYHGEEIYHQVFNIYIRIKNVKQNKDKSYSVHSKDDDTWYDYKSLKELQESIAKAQAQKGLL